MGDHQFDLARAEGAAARRKNQPVAVLRVGEVPFPPFARRDDRHDAEGRSAVFLAPGHVPGARGQHRTDPRRPVPRTRRPGRARHQHRGRRRALDRLLPLGRGAALGVGVRGLSQGLQQRDYAGARGGAPHPARRTAALARRLRDRGGDEPRERPQRPLARNRAARGPPASRSALRPHRRDPPAGAARLAHGLSPARERSRRPYQPGLPRAARPYLTMRLAIHHETAYRYTAPAHYSIQQLRLTPRPEAHQRVLSWRIDAPGKLQRFVDAYGNVAHTLVITAPHDAIRVVVAGSVEIEAPPADPGAQDLSPLVFAVATPLTEAEGAVRDFAALHLKKTGRPEDFLALAEGICGAVAYETGITEVTSTAANALEIGRGVCQDHAHLFIACCRSMNVPVRYVSGYVDPGHDEPAASHAWADVWIEGEAWASVDFTHHVLARERHCRLAIGRDYLSAAPVRGARTDGGEESLHVE